MPLFARAALEWPVLIGVLSLNELPPLLLTEAKTSATRLAGALRASYQAMATLPVVWSTAIWGRNLLLGVPSSLTWTWELQVAPLSSEKRSRISVSLLSGASVSV